MDFEKFLRSGIVVRNPNHKEGSKKKNNPPKLTKSTKLEDYDNSAPAAVRYVNKYKPNFGPAGYIFNPIEDLYKEYKPKDKDPEDWVVSKDAEFNRWTSQDTINKIIKDENKLRAEKQSWLAQTGDMLMQGIVNEVILGTFSGISNLIDAGLRTVGLADNDYSNWFSQIMEEWQNSIRDEFKIYRKDPDASWDLGDWGWWTSNGVSILSSASMLLPSTGIVKGLGWLGKNIKVGRAVSKAGRVTSYNTAKFANWATKSITGGNRTRRIMKNINNGTEIATTAFLSRTMEGYMEAREVYNEVYDEALNKLNSFTNDDKDKFFRINPNLKGKSNEEIAKYIAGESADETFGNDYAMLALDIMQFKTLKNLWRGKPTYKVSGGMKEFNKRVAASVNSNAKTNLDKVTLRDRINYRLNNPIESLWRGITGIEFTEGFEEIYQGIQTEKGKEVAKRIFDPSYKNKSIYDYLQDGHITEQGFWGILGAGVFKVIGNGLGRLYKEADIAYNKKWGKDKYDTKQIALMRMGYEKSQIEEIKNREAIIKKFNSDMQQLENSNISTRQVEKYTNGNVVKDENGNVKFKELTEQEKAQEKEDLMNEFIATMTINSANAGTYDLLKEYIQDPEVKKLLSESADGELVSRSLLSKMDDVYEKYRTNIYNIYQSLDYIDDNVAKLAAKQLTHNQLGIESSNTELNSIKSEIEALNGYNDDSEAYLQASRRNLIRSLYNGINDVLTSLESKKIALELDYSKGTISKQAYNQYKRDLNNERRALHKYAKDNFIELQEDKEYTIDGKKSYNEEYTYLNKLDDKLKEFLNNIVTTTYTNANSVPDSIKKLLDRQIEQEYEIVRREMAIPKTQDDYNDIYNYVESNLGLYTQLKYYAAAENVRDWLKKQNNLTEAAQKLADGNIKELQEELDILRIGHNSTRKFIKSIDEEIESEQKRRNKEAEKEREVKVDGEIQNEENAKRNKDLLDEEEAKDEIENETKTNTEIEEQKTNEDENGSVPFTGEEQEAGEIVDDFYSPDESIETIDDTIVNYEDDIVDIESQSAKDVSIIEANYEISNDAFAASTASDTLMKWISKDKTILDTLKKGYNTEELNELIDRLADELILNGVSESHAHFAAKEGVKSISKILYNLSKDNKYLTLLNQLALNSKINPNDFASSKKFIGKKVLNETVEEFIREWCKKRGISLDRNRIVINTELLLRDIINDESIGIEQAKYIIRNMRDYLASNNSKQFLFDNRSIIYNLKNSIGDLINQIITRRTTIAVSENMHVNLPTRSDDKNAARDILSKSKPGQKLTFETKGNSISIKANGIEIGYLGQVTNDTDGTNLRLKAQGKGFVWKYTKTTVNGKEHVISNLDEFFSELINATNNDYKQILDILYDYLPYFVKYKTFKLAFVSDKDATTIYNNPIIQHLIAKGHLTKGSSNNIEISQRIINDLCSILFRYAAYGDMYDKSELNYAYSTWKNSAYNNYSQTKQIQDIINAGYKPDAIIDEIQISPLSYGNQESDISDINVTDSRKINSTDNPIVYFLDNETTVDDHGNTYNTKDLFRPGGAGFLLTIQQGKPIIASITDTHLVKDTKFKKLIKDELTKLITNFISGKLSFDELSKSLSNLMGGIINGVGTKGNHLLSGVKVIQDANRIGLTINNKAVVIFYKNRNKTNIAGTGVTHINEKYNNGRISFSNTNDKLIDNIVNELMDNLKFNILYIMPKNVNSSTVRNNKYFGKKDNKFVINIGELEEKYDSYTDFVLNNNIAITNQDLKKGNIAIIKEDITGVTINVRGKDLTSNPVKDELTTTNKSINDIITNATKENPANGLELMEAIGLNEESINIIIGKIDNIPSLIPTNIIYDSKLKEEAATNGDITRISKKGLTELNKDKRKAIRILLHERMHQLFKEQNVFARENIVNELIDTFNEAVNAARKIKPGTEHYNTAKKFLDWVDKEGFNPEQYKQTISVENTLDDRRLFAEEWLVESLTQPGLAEMLNSIQYKKADLKQAEKASIWRRILNALFKLLGVNFKDINNFSILAEHYILLSNSINNINTAKTETITENIINEEQINTNKNEDNKNDIERIDDTINTKIDDINIEQSFDTTDLNNTDDLDYLGDEEFFSSKDFIDNTSTSRNVGYKENLYINPKGEIPFTNIEDYISRFPEASRNNIRKMINNNEIAFVCN